jgi:hypothetical protein
MSASTKSLPSGHDAAANLPTSWHLQLTVVSRAMPNGDEQVVRFVELHSKRSWLITSFGRKSTVRIAG